MLLSTDSMLVVKVSAGILPLQDEATGVQVSQLKNWRSWYSEGYSKGMIKPLKHYIKLTLPSTWHIIDKIWRRKEWVYLKKLPKHLKDSAGL